MTCEDACLDDDDECRLEAPHLLLRSAGIEDAPEIARHANDRHLAEMTSRIPHPYTLAHAEAFLEQGTDALVFTILERASLTFLGLCSLAACEREGRAELGYWIARPFWNRGHATEAAQTVLDYGFGPLSLDAIEVRCRVVNNASRRVIQKCGFGYVGTGLSTSLVAGRVASETYRMDRRTWQSLKSWGLGR